MVTVKGCNQKEKGRGLKCQVIVLSIGVVRFIGFCFAIQPGHHKADRCIGFKQIHAVVILKSSKYCQVYLWCLRLLVIKFLCIDYSLDYIKIITMKPIF